MYLYAVRPTQQHTTEVERHNSTLLIQSPPKYYSTVALVTPTSAKQQQQRQSDVMNMKTGGPIQMGKKRRRVYLVMP